MADNVQADLATTSGAIFKTDQDSGDSSHVPFTKLMFGALNTFTVVDSTHGLPVEVVASSLLDGVEASLTAIAGYVDGLETLSTSANALLTLIEGETSNLTGIAGNVSVIVSGLTSIQSDLVTIGGYLDGLEGYVDGLETLIGTTNSTLSTINGKITACNTGAVVISSALPAGTNVLGHVILDASSAVIGHVIVDSGTVAVTGTFWQATQPVSIAATVTVDTELPAAASLADATANPSTTSAGSLNLLFNGTTWDRVRGDTTNGIDVDVTRVKPDGTNTMPSLDAAARAGFVKVTDGTNTMPTMDSTARPGFVNLNLAGTAVSGNSGNKDAGTLRVVLATDQPALTNTQPVKDLAQTSGGLSMHQSGPLANSNNATTVKASAGQVYALQVFNVTATVAYLKLYNKATSPSPGSDTPVKVIAIPANTAVGGVVMKWEKGLEFTTGIAYAVVTGISGTDNTSVAANSGIVNIDYK